MDQKRSLPCRDLPLRRSEDQTTLNIRERAGGRKRSPRQRIRGHVVESRAAGGEFPYGPGAQSRSRLSTVLVT